MQFLVIPTEILKEFDTEWEYRRKSNDGTKALLHREIYDRLVPSAMTLNLVYNEDGTTTDEVSYPFPLVSSEEINNMSEFHSKDEINKN